jgi:hypothetical protein
MAPMWRHLKDYSGSINVGQTAGEVRVLLYVSADSTLGAAKAAIGVIERCFAEAQKPIPGRLSRVQVEAHPGDPPAT